MQGGGRQPTGAIFNDDHGNKNYATLAGAAKIDAKKRRTKVKTYKIIKGEDPGRFKGGGATVWHVYSDDEDGLEDLDTDASVEKLTAAEAEMPAANEPESRPATSPALTNTPAAEESAAGPAGAIATEGKALVLGTPVKKRPGGAKACSCATLEGRQESAWKRKSLVAAGS